MKLRLILSSLALSVSGCIATGDAIRADYIQADRATYEAIAPEYLRYVQADQALDSEERTRRERTISTWRMRLEQAEHPVDEATGNK